MQVTINGMPIYYYSKDQAAGDIMGQGVGGVWYLVSPSGEMIRPPQQQRLLGRRHALRRLRRRQRRTGAPLPRAKAA